MNGKRMGRVDRKRRQHREDVGKEMILEPALLLCRQVLAVQDLDAVFGNHAAQVAPERLLGMPAGRAPLR
jgi:hypothetical protein